MTALGSRALLKTQYHSEELYFMLLVTLVLKTLLSISQNGINPITLNKQLGNHLNMDIINASISLSSFPLVDASSSLCSFLLVDPSRFK
jgi:hypothetical protein